MENVLRRVYAEVAGAGEAATRAAVAEAAWDFFRATEVWTRELTAPLAPPETHYELPVGEDERAHKLAMVRASGHPLRALGSHQWFSDAPGYRWTSEPETIAIELSPAATSYAGTLEVIAVLVPLSIEAVPAEYVSAHGDAFFAGAVSNLLRQANRPYTNLGLAAEFMRRYRSLRGSAVLLARTGRADFGTLSATRGSLAGKRALL